MANHISCVECEASFDIGECAPEMVRVCHKERSVLDMPAWRSVALTPEQVARLYEMVSVHHILNLVDEGDVPG